MVRKTPTTYVRTPLKTILRTPKSVTKSVNAEERHRSQTAMTNAEAVLSSVVAVSPSPVKAKISTAKEKASITKERVSIAQISAEERTLDVILLTL